MLDPHSLSQKNPRADLHAYLPSLQQFLVCLLIFLIPSNLFVKFFESTAYVNGIMSDYLLSKIYASDLVIIALLGTWLWEKGGIFFIKLGKELIHKIKKLQTIDSLKIIAASLLVLIIRQFFTADPVASVWYLLKLIEMSLLGWFLLTHDRKLKNEFAFLALALTLIFQSLLGIYQFQTQSSFAGYQFLGEPNLRSFSGIAKAQLFGGEKILPYGTTAHPNILGGFLSVGIMGLILLFKKAKLLRFAKVEKIVVGVTILLALTALFLTQSLSAWLSLIIASIYIYSKLHSQRFQLIFFTKKSLLTWTGLLLAIPFILIFINNILPNTPSIQRRVILNAAVLRSIKTFPLFGTGLNTTTIWIEQFAQTSEIVRFVQPIHHALLLWISETGLVGVLIVGGLWINLFHQQKLRKTILPILWILLPIMAFDHYLLTNQTGLLLIIFLIACSTTLLKKESN